MLEVPDPGLNLPVYFSLAWAFHWLLLPKERALTVGLWNLMSNLYSNVLDVNEADKKNLTGRSSDEIDAFSEGTFCIALYKAISIHTIIVQHLIYILNIH